MKPANTILTEVAVHVVAAGEQGPPGSGFNPDSLPAAGLAVPDEIIVKQSGVWGRATWAQLVDWLGTVPAPTNQVLVGSDTVVVGSDFVIYGA